MSSRRVVVLIIVAALAVGLLLRPSRNGDAIAEVQHALRDNQRFGNGPKSGLTFAALSHKLLEDGRSCAKQHGVANPRCRARFTAAAFASATAFAVRTCTQPGVYQARVGMLEELAGIAVLDKRPIGTVVAPSPPSVPRC